jgi:acyl-CoA reductase-like NAD-dependent aldehyde dehydrogenase
VTAHGTTAGFPREIVAYASREPWVHVGGRQVGAAPAGALDVVDPSTGQVVGAIARSGAGLVREAVEAAAAAVGSWGAAHPRVRAEALDRLAAAIEADAPTLALLETLDTGKPLASARGEVAMAARTFRYYAGWSTKVFGEVNPTGGDRFSYTAREPVGVCAAITPWNYPLLIASWKVAAALAFGNACVVKPSEHACLSVLRLGELASASGLPGGLLNVVTGDGGTGALLCGHAGVDLVTFTGSTAVGREVVRATAANLARVSLELGGKSPALVFSDCDLPAAVDGALEGTMSNSGQMCVACSRVLVQRPRYDEFVERAARAAAAKRVGPGLADGSELGPIITASQRDRVLGHLRAACEAGAEVRSGGVDAPVVPGFEGGFYVSPTVLAQPVHDGSIVREEVFGPVLVAVPFDDEEEALALAADTAYGLAASVWTESGRRAHRVAAALRCGMVWVNTFGDTDEIVSVGGYRASGYGRELGLHSIDLYTQTKAVWVDTTTKGR